MEKLDQSQQLCGTQSGCYFDLELHEYRRAYGDAVLPGVPVCHLAIRNSVFQTKASLVEKKVSVEHLLCILYTTDINYPTSCDSMGLGIHISQTAC